MSTKQKKRIIATLLTVSCILSAWLLLSYNPAETKTIQNLEEADSLIQHKFRQFSIHDTQITQIHQEIDSGFVRKKYLVDVAPSFSKTQFHAGLNRLVYPYGIETPARLDLSNQSMNIFMYYQNTIIRTIHLQMDPDLIQQTQPGSILIIFPEPPSTKILNQLISFGEPIFLIFQVQNALRAHELKSQFKNKYEDLAFSFVRSNGSPLLDSTLQASDLQPIKRFGELSPNAQVVSFLNEHGTNSQILKVLSKSSLRFISAHRAIRFNQRQDQKSLQQLLNRFEQKARRGKHPVLILHHRKNLLNHLHKSILKFKKTGLEIVPPPHHTY